MWVLIIDVGLPAYRRPNRLLQWLIKPKSKKRFGLTTEAPKLVATSTFSESHGRQEANRCWLTGAVSVLFVGFSDGSSAGNKIKIPSQCREVVVGIKKATE